MYCIRLIYKISFTFQVNTGNEVHVYVVFIVLFLCDIASRPLFTHKSYGRNRSFSCKWDSDGDWQTMHMCFKVGRSVWTWRTASLASHCGLFFAFNKLASCQFGLSHPFRRSNMGSKATFTLNLTWEGPAYSTIAIIYKNLAAYLFRSTLLVLMLED